MPKKLIPVSVVYHGIGAVGNSVKIGDQEVSNLSTSLRVDMGIDRSSTLYIDLNLDNDVNLTFDANVTVHLTALDGQVIQKKLPNGDIQYQVIRQPRLFPKT